MGIQHFEWWMPAYVAWWAQNKTNKQTNKKEKRNHLLFSFLVRIVLFLHFYRRDLLQKELLHHFHWLHLNNYAPYENKCFNPRNQNHRAALATRVNFICARCVTRYAVITRVKYAATPCTQATFTSGGPLVAHQWTTGCHILMHREMCPRWSTECAASGGPLDVPHLVDH